MNLNADLPISGGQMMFGLVLPFKAINQSIQKIDKDIKNSH